MCSLRSKLKTASMRYGNVKCLERHAYAPEMNKLHMNDGTVHKVPQQTTIVDAIDYLRYEKNKR